MGEVNTFFAVASVITIFTFVGFLSGYESGKVSCSSVPLEEKEPVQCICSWTHDMGNTSLGCESSGVPPAEPSLRENIVQTTIDYYNTHKDLYKANIYDCTEMSKELQIEIWQKYKVYAEVYQREVNCSYIHPGRDDYFWDKEVCESFDGRHDFLKVWLPDGQFMFVDEMQGMEVTPEYYPAYNMLEGAV